MPWRSSWSGRPVLPATSPVEHRHQGRLGRFGAGVAKGRYEDDKPRGQATNEGRPEQDSNLRPTPWEGVSDYARPPMGCTTGHPRTIQVVWNPRCSTPSLTIVVPSMRKIKRSAFGECGVLSETATRCGRTMVHRRGPPRHKEDHGRVR